MTMSARVVERLIPFSNHETIKVVEVRIPRPAGASRALRFDLSVPQVRELYVALGAICRKVPSEADVDHIADEIRRHLLAMAPHVPSKLDYDALCDDVAAAHGYEITKRGRSTDNEPFVVIERGRQ